MSALLEALVDHGDRLLAGTTAVLAIGLAALMASRAPAHRQRMAELTVIVALAWLLLFPLPWGAWLPREAPLPSETGLGVVEAATVARVGVEEGVLRPAPASSVPQGSPVAHADPAPSAAHAAPAGMAPTVALAAERAPVATTVWPVALARLYLAGSIVALGYLLLGWILLRRILATRRVLPADLRALWEQMVSESGVSSVRLVLVDAQVSPFCFGLIRPCIVFPSALWEGEPAARHLLRHELAHVARRDPWGRLLFGLALPVLWFHPLFWGLRRQGRLAAELLADDRAAHLGGRAAYARCLIGLAERVSLRAPRVLGAAGVLRSPSEFSRRITMLMSRSDRLVARCSRSRRALLLMLAVALPVMTALAFSPRLPAQEAELQAENAALRAQVAAMNAQIAELTAQIDVLTEKMARAARATEGADVIVALDDVTNAPWTEYVVRPGDTLESIARAHGFDAEGKERILGVNDELREQQLRPGQKIQIPLEGRRSENDQTRITLPTESEWHKIRARAPVASRRSVAWPRPTEDPTIDLATRIVEARGELEMAERELDVIAARAKAGQTDQLELARAQVRIQTARQKHTVVRAVVESEIQATSAELEATKAQWESSGSDRDALMWQSLIVRLENRIKILRSVMK